METIDVVITMGFRFSEEDFDEFRSVDPRLRIRPVMEAHRPFLRTPGDGSDPNERELQALLEQADVLLAAYEPVNELNRRAPQLKWVHTLSAGVEYYFRSGVPREGLLFTNGSGPSGLPIAEHVLMSILALSKGLPGSMRSQVEHRWQRPRAFELAGKTVGIVGLGHIGGEAGRLARAVGCRVIGSRRSVTAAQAEAEGIDLLLPPSDLPRLLAESDFVVLAAPATGETAALIDAAAIEQMKPGAFLINIARGALVDEPALVAALKSGRLGGASLDVFAKEPLPADSELWDLPTVIITPHSSSISEHTGRRQVALFKENLRRFVAGEPMLNRVDVQRGY